MRLLDGISVDEAERILGAVFYGPWPSDFLRDPEVALENVTAIRHAPVLYVETTPEIGPHLDDGHELAAVTITRPRSDGRHGVEVVVCREGARVVSLAVRGFQRSG